MSQTFMGTPLRYLEHHISLCRLQELRLIGDDVGDAALAALLDVRKEAEWCSTRALRSYTSAILSNVNDTDPRLRALIDQVSIVPDWLDWCAVKRGQRVYLKYSVSVHLGLLYYSLVGGFSAPKITAVLEATKYLTTDDGGQVWRRLLETLEMVIDCMDNDNALSIDGEGFKSVLHVRMLHSRVRRRILQSSSASWDVNANGKPINQADLLVTLLSFSVNVLEVIKKIGAPWLTVEEEQDYLHLWRYIGFLIGVDRELLSLHFSSLCAARGAMESLVLDLIRPNDRSQYVCNNILLAVSKRPPLNLSHGVNCQLSRSLLGTELADSLSIPKPPFTSSLYAKFILFVATCLNAIVPLFSSDDKATTRKRRILRAVLNKMLATAAPEKLQDRNRSSGIGCPFALS